MGRLQKCPIESHQNQPKTHRKHRFSLSFVKSDEISFESLRWSEKVNVSRVCASSYTSRAVANAGSVETDSDLRIMSLQAVPLWPASVITFLTAVTIAMYRSSSFSTLQCAALRG